MKLKLLAIILIFAFAGCSYNCREGDLNGKICYANHLLSDVNVTADIEGGFTVGIADVLYGLHKPLLTKSNCLYQETTILNVVSVEVNDSSLKVVYTNMSSGSQYVFIENNENITKSFECRVVYEYIDRRPVWERDSEYQFCPDEVYESGGESPRFPWVTVD
jgi:hypothetical protein